MEFSADVMVAAEDLIPHMDEEAGSAMRDSMVYFASKAITQERERCEQIVRTTLARFYNEVTQGKDDRFGILKAIRNDGATAQPTAPGAAMEAS